MNTRHSYKVKGFSLVEMIVVIAIISVLAAIIVPALTGWVKKARIAVAISDARLIKTTVENSLVNEFEYNQGNIPDPDVAFNKVIYLSSDKKEYKKVGCFTNVSWYIYKQNGNTSGEGADQKIDMTIARGLDAQFSNEKWKQGARVNPLSYNNTTYNCAKYLSDKRTNFGLVVAYDDAWNVRFMQIYRKGILVTYVNGEYIANMSSNVSFTGTKTWDKIYTDAGMTAPEGMNHTWLHNKKFNGSGWY